MTCRAARGTHAPLTAYRVAFERGSWARLEVTAFATTPQEAREAAQRGLRATNGPLLGWEYVSAREVGV